MLLMILTWPVEKKNDSKFYEDSQQDNLDSIVLDEKETDLSESSSLLEKSPTSNEFSGIYAHLPFKEMWKKPFLYFLWAFFTVSEKKI